MSDKENKLVNKEAREKQILVKNGYERVVEKVT